MRRGAGRQRERRAGAGILRLGIVLAGIILGQVILYGPSLIGRKVLLPLDILAAPGVYLPRTPQVKAIQIQNIYLSDPIYVFEPARRFAVSELHAGRLPMWAPYQYAGAPFIIPKFSPFLALGDCAASPVVLAWAQLLAAVVAGLGAYLFFRRALKLSFWPAAFGAWCYPLTGFFVFWQGYPTGYSVYWLPWLLLAVDKTVRGHVLGPCALAIFTCLALVSGNLDVAGQVLLASGLYALWCLYDAFPKAWFAASARKKVVTLAVAWGLGIMLAGPQLLPLLQYARTGVRMVERSGGEEDRPPVGLKALPQTVLPDMYGKAGMMKTGSFRYTKDSQQESSAAAYTGLLATMLVAPLAFCDRRRLSPNLFWAGMAAFGLSWCLDIPGVVSLLRLPGLNMMSHNRLVFITCFAVLCLAATGLEVVRKRDVRWNGWLWLAPGLLAGLYLWCSYRALFLPEPIATELEQILQYGGHPGWIRSVADVRQVQASFVQQYTIGAALCALGVVGWLLVRFRPAWLSRLFPVLGVVLVADLLWFAHGRNVQCDPALYYPRIPVLEQVAHAAPGRVIGYKCLPACLAEMAGLRDVRGYDAVDPARYTQLLALTAEPGSPVFSYARVQWLTPKVDFTSDGNIRLSPILDMLGVRYVIFRGTPPPGIHPAFQGTDYWVMVNRAALPSAFVPRRTQVVRDASSRLEKLGSAQFDPQDVAYVESPVRFSGPCRGTAKILRDTPDRVTLSVQMETPGLVVLADRWDKGWRAWLNGHPAQILRVNQALRGVEAPPGASTIEFRYEPASFEWGLALFGVAVLVLAGWTILNRLGGDRARREGDSGVRHLEV